MASKSRYSDGEELRVPGVDFDWDDVDKTELQSLSGKKKLLFELEQLLDVELPAMRKIRGRRGQMKSCPAITIKDLRRILYGVLELADVDESELVILESVEDRVAAHIS